MMQTAALYQQLPLATKQQQQQHGHQQIASASASVSASMSADSTRASVTHLLAGACSTPCSTAAHTFMQIVPPLSRFQLALDVLMPMLDSPVELPQRILVSYMLYALYAPHPIAINPFKSVLHARFVKERAVAVQVDQAGGVNENEQLVWVLWKILRGDGSDIGPFSPNTLARSPLPPKLRAAHLSLEEDVAALAQAPAATNANRVGNADTAVPPAAAPESADGSVRAEESTQAGPSTVPTTTAAERDREMEQLSHAMTLLLAARDRVLTIAEQRLTSPPVVTSVDLPGIIAHNPPLAHPLLNGLLSADSPLAPGPDVYLDVLRRLPPTLPSFDLMGRLLRDTTAVRDAATGGRTTIADLVRVDVLGWFIHECVSWLDRAEQDEREGNISDDRFAKGVQNLCRFYTALIKLSIVDPASDADSAEMAHFTLRNARFEEANALYRLLASSSGAF
ncbi:hypothetical protein PYCCODRAFT_1451490 [Trametes coccinea BRFM310]|uniref:Uncharacterized protein n=1 Tax=Trametes coccinea (strain BRFM310) TaxID=1353009 RepID=A0A1Y2IRI1_TRAC3|nr:hypothetical protein PYCCODRAFT_1451490 [Trametes coccinea BRFM310]